jgi:hypothetical protein
MQLHPLSLGLGDSREEQRTVGILDEHVGDIAAELEDRRT